MELRGRQGLAQTVFVMRARRWHRDYEQRRSPLSCKRRAGYSSSTGGVWFWGLVATCAAASPYLARLRGQHDLLRRDTLAALRRARESSPVAADQARTVSG